MAVISPNTRGVWLTFLTGAVTSVVSDMVTSLGSSGFPFLQHCDRSEAVTGVGQACDTPNERSFTPAPRDDLSFRYSGQLAKVARNCPRTLSTCLSRVDAFHFAVLIGGRTATCTVPWAKKTA